MVGSRFDAGLCELFVVRVAVNILSPEIAGSLQYAGSYLEREILAPGRERKAIRVSPDPRNLRAASKGPQTRPDCSNAARAIVDSNRMNNAIGTRGKSRGVADEHGFTLWLFVDLLLLGFKSKGSISNVVLSLSWRAFSCAAI